MKYNIEIQPLADHYVVAAKDRTTGSTVQVFTLNQSGVEMLNLLAEGKSIESISQILSEKYGATIDLVASDVQIFVHSIEEKGLL